jgi:hypothetical protein
VHYNLAFMRLVHAIVHEMGHLYETFLAHGRGNTPASLSGDGTSRNTHHLGLEGEAGEYFERRILGGVVDFLPDKHDYGLLQHEGVNIGWPYLRCANGTSRRVSYQSLANLSKPAWRAPTNSALELLEPDSNKPAIDTFLADPQPGDLGHAGDVEQRREGTPFPMDALQLVAATYSPTSL